VFSEPIHRPDQGVEMRRRVLGTAYVDRALASADGFTADLQEQLNANCWGNAWTRPGIDLKTRSIVTLTALAVSGKVNELKAHTLGALRNGCSVDEIKEVFLHLIPYAGFPTAITAFQVAQPVVAEWLQEQDTA
jgi:alkylhydroperoxidase/carboxymuconolactone decarboxylase family protein YurZ